MAIGSIDKSGNSFSGISEYVLAQGKYKEDEKNKAPEVIESNNIYSTNYKDIGREFREIADQNKKVKKPVMHYSVSFRKGDNTTEDERRKVVASTLKDLGVDKNNHQYMIVKHSDNNPHYHVVINRVGLDGKILSDSYSKNRLEVAIDKAEKKLGIDNSLAEKRRFVYNPNNEKGYDFVQKPIKEKAIIREPKDKKLSLSQKKDFIQDKINEALTNKRVSNPEQLKAELQKSKIEFEYKTNIKGLAQTSFKYDKIAVKGSQIDFKASVIDKQFKANLEYKNTLNNNEKIADKVFKEKGQFYQYEENINSIIQQGKGINTKEAIENLSQPTKTDTEKQYNAIKIKSFQDLDLKQQKYIVELKKYEELKNKEPQKVPLFSFNKSEIIKANEELKKQQNQAKPPQLPRYEILSIYEETRAKALNNQTNWNVKPKTTYEMEKKQSLSKEQEQGLNSTQQRILEQAQARKQEQNQDQNKERKRPFRR